jgi:phosphoribosylformylglycinamidine synthase subunit PurQ / glutaminase
MKFGVVVFPGSNCDEDIVYALRDVLGQEVVKLWHKDKSLNNADFIILPGGFSYGDYLRSGAIARFSPIMDSITSHAEKGGFVLGICNGFQILTESHLLPGALLRNMGQKFICSNVYIKPEVNNRIFSGLDNKAYKIPIAHAEGRFFASTNTIQSIEDNNQVIFRYCDEEGMVNETANPNGSVNNIAGITNKAGNVFGMMPHPERACENYLGNTDGKSILECLLEKVIS